MSASSIEISLPKILLLFFAVDKQLDISSEFNSLLTLCVTSSVAIAFVLKAFQSAIYEGFELVCLVSGYTRGLCGGIVVVVVRHLWGWMESEQVWRKRMY